MAFSLNKDASAASLLGYNPCSSGVISINLRRLPLKSGRHSNGFAHCSATTATTAAVATSTRWGIDFCVKLHLWSQRKIEREGEPNLKGREGSSQESNEACAFVKKSVVRKLGHGWLGPCVEN